MSSSASSSPMRQAPKPSPRSALRSISMVRCSSSRDEVRTAGRRSRRARRPARRACRPRSPSRGAVTGSSSAPICSKPSACPARHARRRGRARGSSRSGWRVQETPSRGVPSTTVARLRRPVAGAARRRRSRPRAAIAAGTGGPSGPLQLQHVDVGRRQPGRRVAATDRSASHRQFLALRPRYRSDKRRASSSQRRVCVERGQRLVPGRLDKADAAADRRLARAARDRPRSRCRSWDSRRKAGRRTSARSAGRRAAPGSRPARCRASASPCGATGSRAVPASR